MVAEAGLGECLVGAAVPAGESRPLALEHGRDDLERLFELVESVGEGAEVIAECIVFELEPPRADTEDRAALAHHIEGGDRLGQKRRIAVGVAGDQRAQLDALGGGGQPAQRRVRLEHRLVRRAQRRQLVEVVHHEE